MVQGQSRPLFASDSACLVQLCCTSESAEPGGGNNQAVPGWHQAPADHGRGDHLGAMPKLQLVLKGIRRGQMEAGRMRSARSPMTPEQLLILKRAWTSDREPEGDIL